MKKQINKKQGFSLIELIVVIAVIAAIAAVIVPTIGNFSGTAKSTAEKRSVQLWNSIYLQAKSATADNLGNGTKVADGNTLSAIAAYKDIDGDGDYDINFDSPAVTVTGGTITWTSDDAGAAYTATAD